MSKKAAGKKVAAKKKVSKKATAKKAVAKKKVSKKTASKKATSKKKVSKKAASKKAAAKKKVSKETASKKATSKKKVSQKTASKKAVATKTTVKKTSQKKAIARKPVAKKQTAHSKESILWQEFFSPLEDRVLVEELTAEAVSASGLWLPQVIQEHREGIVRAVGPGARDQKARRRPLSLSVGDHILLGRYGGQDLQLKGEPFLIIRESEVIGVKDKP